MDRRSVFPVRLGLWATLLLLVGTLLGSWPRFPVATATTTPPETPTIDHPPTYFRPDADSWQQLVTQKDGSTELLEPVNLIVYGPPAHFGPRQAGEAVQTLKLAAPRERGKLPYAVEDSEFSDDKWVEFTGQKWRVRNPIAWGDYLFPFEYDTGCYLENFWSPTQSDEATLQPIVGVYATTQCPAVFGPVSLMQEPEYEQGIEERNRFRIYSYKDEENGIDAAYISVSHAENFAWPTRCGRYGVPNPPPTIGGHCLTDMNEARDLLVADIVAGAANKGWTVVANSYDLPNEPIYENATGGPYSDPPEWRGPNIPRVESSTTPGETRGPWSTDGRVAVICLDPSNGDYCDSKPAERPVAFNDLSPAHGAFLEVGKETDISLGLGYSDGRREISTVAFRLTYTTQAGTEATVSETATREEWSATAREGMWQASLTVPTDARLDAPSNTQKATFATEVCDDEGACWTRSTAYVLRPAAAATVLVTAGHYPDYTDRFAANATVLVTNLEAALPAETYTFTTLEDDLTRAVTAADLEEVDIWVALLPTTGRDTEFQLAGQFVREGGSLLLIGEHPLYPAMIPGEQGRTLSSAPALAESFGFELGPDLLAGGNGVIPGGCAALRPEQRARVVSPRLGLPIDTRVAAVAASRVAGGDPVLTAPSRIPNASAQPIMAIDVIGDGRVSVTGDLNMFFLGEFALCPDVTENDAFLEALFAWLARRV